MPHIELSSPTPGQEHLTELILDECNHAAVSAARQIVRRVPGVSLSAMAILRDTSYRKTHFRDAAALRSEYVEGFVGGFNQVALRKIRLPAEAITSDLGPDPSYPARIIDLSLRKKSEPDSEPWWTHPTAYFEQEYTNTARWNCSLYVGRGMRPVLVDQDVINDLNWGVSGFDNHFSAIGNLVTDLTYNDFSLPDYDEFSDIATAVQSAVLQDQDLGETLLECRSIAEGRTKSQNTNRVAAWFDHAALVYGITYMDQASFPGHLSP